MRIQIRGTIIDIIYGKKRKADVFCIHLKHWKEGASFKKGACPKCCRIK